MKYQRENLCGADLEVPISIFLVDLLQWETLARRDHCQGEGQKGSPTTWAPFLLRTNLLNEEYTAKCKAGEQRS